MAPAPGRLSTAIEPPSSVAFSWAMARPRPLPAPVRGGVGLREAVEQARCEARARCPGRRLPTSITVSAASPSMRTRRAAAAVLDGVSDQVGDDPLDRRRSVPTIGRVARDARRPAPSRGCARRPRSAAAGRPARGGRPRRPRPGARSPSGRRSGAAAGRRRGRAAVSAGASSAGRRSAWLSSSAASFTSAVSGVRSSWATSAVNRRSRAWASVSAVILAWSASAMWLNDAAHSPNSSRAAGGQAGVEQALGERPGGGARAGHRLQRAPRQQRPDEAGERHEHEPAGHEDVAELVEVGPDLALVVEVVELGVPRGQRLGHRQVGHAGDRLALVCDLARPGQATQVGRDGQPPGRDAPVAARSPSRTCRGWRSGPRAGRCRPGRLWSVTAAIRRFSRLCSSARLCESSSRAWRTTR